MPHGLNVKNLYLIKENIMSIILKNCNLIDGISEEVINQAYLLVEDEEIKKIGFDEPPANIADEVIDCSGKYVLPGLIDAHVHLVWDGSPDPQSTINHLENDSVTLKAYKHAFDFLQQGITTVRDLGSPDRTTLHVRDAINSKMLQGPTILTSGMPICMTGGHLHNMSREVDGSDEARKATRTVMKEGADLVKVMATGGIYTLGEEPQDCQLTIEEMKAITEEAHKKNKKVAAHAYGIKGILNCIKAGVDTIEHGIFADLNTLSLMKKEGMYLIPTMAVMRREVADQGKSIPSWAYEKVKDLLEPHVNTFQKAIQKGVKIATGTDCGSPLTPPKYYFDELSIMNDAGMSPMEVIHSSTRIAGECLGLNNRGILAAGKKADLLVVDENPLENLDVLKKDKKIMKNGSFLYNKNEDVMTTSV